MTTRRVGGKVPEFLVSPLPINGEWFNLEIDNTDDPRDSLARAGAGWDDIKEWNYSYFGHKKLCGKQIHQVRLVHLGFVWSFGEARDKADLLGCRLVESQALESFKARFPKPDGKHHVVFGGSIWWPPNSLPVVFYLEEFQGKWLTRSRWEGKEFGFDVYWHWLVAKK